MEQSLNQYAYPRFDFVGTLQDLCKDFLSLQEQCGCGKAFCTEVLNSCTLPQSAPYFPRSPTDCPGADSPRGDLLDC